MNALHEHDVVHQDVRADNIILTSCGRWMLIDYGLARILKPEEPKGDKLKKKDFKDLRDVLLWVEDFLI